MVPTLKDIIVNLLGIINTYIIPIIFAGALLAFFFGIVKYIKGGGVDDKGAGLQMMTNGIIGLTVMFSVYGLILLILSEFDITSGGALSAPDLSVF